MSFMKKGKLILKISVITLSSLVVVGTMGFLIWTSDYYRADSIARNYCENDKTIITKDDYYILPTTESKTGIIFYPGAKVEAISYLPILEKIRSETNMTCVLAKMPLNLAFF